MVDEAIHQFFRGFPRTAHPMAMLCGVGALSAFYHDDLTTTILNIESSSAPSDSQDAYSCSDVLQTRDWSAFYVSANDMGFAENFLHMMFGTPATTKGQSSACQAVDTSSCSMRIMNRTRRFNRTTRRVHRCQSICLHRLRNCSALGPAHGGANEAVLDMLNQIGDESGMKNLSPGKDKDDQTMGFGHRVYKNCAPEPR